VNFFILGIDNKTIKRVVIYDIDKSPSQLWQKIGRCSRDNTAGHAIIFSTTQSSKLFVKDVCLRHCILSKLMGYDIEQPEYCNSTINNVNCHCLTCCSVCKRKCELNTETMEVE